MIALVTDSKERYENICNSIELEKYPNGNYKLEDGTQIIFVNSVARAKYLTVSEIVQNVNTSKLTPTKYAELSFAVQKLQSKKSNGTLTHSVKSKEQLSKIKTFNS